MSEELLQRDLLKNPEKIGKWDFYRIGATSIKSLKEHGIIFNIDYKGIEKKKIDALIVLRKSVIAVIEYKKPSEFKTKKQQDDAIEQEREVAKAIGSKLIIATDTQETIWVNAITGKRIKDESGNEIKINFDPKDEKLPELIDKINYSINEKNNQLKPKKLVNPTDLAKQIWQDIWSVSGATPENCLYTFVELFIFKYLSDLDVLKGSHNFYTLLKMYDENTDDEVLETYVDSIRKKIKDLFPYNRIDNTTIINGTIFVSKDQKAVAGYSAVFRKVLNKFNDYGKLEHIDYDFKSKLFESFLKESISKKNWGQFFTPIKAVRAIVEMSKDDIKVGIKMCDPACGVGKFLLEPIISRLDEFFEISKGNLKKKITLHGFDKGFDKDEQKTIILAKANMLIYFSDLIKDNIGMTKQFSDLFNETFTLKTNSILGTLSTPTENEYDLILTNPPYVTSGSSNLKEEISKDGELKSYYKINALGVEGLFMEWIIRALKPNGKAFVVVPDGIFNRQNDKHLRKFILDECIIDGIISLPTKTFFTTPKKTYILALTKKSNKKEIQKTPVFTYLCSEIGETRDIYRFDIDQNDLNDAVIFFNQFKGAKQYFNTTEKRCKIQPISAFNPDEHWSVDRWWSKEEKIELGELEEESIIDIDSFSEFINEISDTIKEFSNILKQTNEKKKSKFSQKPISLNDKTYFDIAIGKRIVKKDIIDIKGDIPIYSANPNNPIGFTDKSNISDFDSNYVIWGIDGDFEYNYIKKNTKFVTTDHCGSIKIKHDSILPEYLMIQLDKAKHIYGFDRELRASLKNMATVNVDIPFNEDGTINTKIQISVIEKYEYITELKNKINEFKSKIEKVIIDTKTSNEFKEFILEDIFDFPSIKGLTADYIQKNQGNIPVYGGRKEETPVGFIKDSLTDVKYFENCLAWNREGSVGYVFWHKHKFTTNDHHRPLVVKKDFINFIDLDYMKYTLEKMLLSQGFEWSKTASKEKVEKFTVPIPTLNNGVFDLKKQKEISQTYLKIDQTKKLIIAELNKILSTNINYE
jgi:type I restriction enzyme M protein